MNIFKWGIIGPGSIAHDFAEDLLLATSGKHVVDAVLGNKEKKVEEFADKFHVRQTFTRLNEFLNSDIDAVYIATPHTMHHEHALGCLKNKIPVLCEKPISINSIQLQNLINTAQQSKTFLMEGMWIRFLPSINKVLDIINERKIGSIISIKASMSFKAPYNPQSRYFNPELGGGSLLDLGIYPIFLATLLLGKPTSIKAAGAISATGIDEACSILLDYPGKQYAALESSLITESDLTAEICGLNGRIKILAPWNEKPTGIEVEIYNGEKITYPCNWEGRGFQYEVDEVVKCLHQHKIESELMSHQFSQQVMEIMDEVRSQLDVNYKKFEQV